MRIRELYLKAFGPFDDLKIPFRDREPGEAGGPGLCVVYGPNEIGKTSAMRAIHDLLYGIPLRSQDNFVHAHGDMRVGARIVFSDGEEFSFLRRKGGKNKSLLAYPVEGETGGDVEAPTQSARLESLIHSIPEDVFDHFYGLDHAALSQGSNALLQSDGELGQALFSAGIGAGNLRTVIEGLDREASELFKARGKTQQINTALEQLKALETNIKQTALKPAAWKEAAGDCAEIDRELERLEAEIEAALAERARCDRLRRSIPLLARLRKAEKTLAAMSDVVELADDFEDRFRNIRGFATRAKESLDRTSQAIEVLVARRAELELDPELVESGESIESLVERVGAYRQELEQLPRREAELARLQADVQSLLEVVGCPDTPGRLAALRAPMSRAGRLRELAGELFERSTRLESASEVRAKALAIVERGSAESSAAESPADPGSLRRLLDRARRLGEIDDRLTLEQTRVEADEDRCERAHSSLGFWNGPLDALDRTAFPEAEVIDGFDTWFDSLARQRESLSAEVDRLAVERRDADERLSRLRGEGAVPSEAERDALRRRRDQSWHEIRRVFIDGDPLEGDDGEDGSEADPMLPDRLESEMKAADQTADRLRTEADRVARESQILARLDRLDSDAKECAAQESELAVTQTQAERDWQALWAPYDVAPGTPSQMRGWLDRQTRLRESVSAVREARSAWNALRSERDEAREAILDELDRLAVGPLRSEAERASGRLMDVIALGDAVASGLESARARAERIREDHSRAARALEDAEATHQRCRAALDAWRLSWAEAVDGLGLPDNPRPPDVEDRLRILDQLFNHLKERDAMAVRIGKMKSDVARFAEDVAAILPRCAPDLEGMKPDEAVLRLRSLLSRAAKQEATRVEIDAALEATRAENESAARVLDEQNAALDELCREAGGAEVRELEPAIADSRALAEARREVEREASKLDEVAEGRSHDELEADLRDVDPDALPGRIERLDRQLEEWKKAEKAALTEMGTRREVLSRMDGSGEASRLAEEAQATLAAIGSHVRRYVSLTLAREILAREIERYREKNKSPVLGRASQLMNALTRGAYVRVRGEYDDADRVQLVVEGLDGQRKQVRALSSGTRDQLFLALRLATLEETLERAEPMPLIADDILVEFDEDRSRAALEVLAELGRKTQILLFSHHAHIAEQARELGTRACVVSL